MLWSSSVASINTRQGTAHWCIRNQRMKEMPTQEKPALKNSQWIWLHACVTQMAGIRSSQLHMFIGWVRSRQLTLLARRLLNVHNEHDAAHASQLGSCNYNIYVHVHLYMYMYVYTCIYVILQLMPNVWQWQLTHKCLMQWQPTHKEPQQVSSRSSFFSCS